MDDTLRLIQHLYGEGDDDPAFRERLIEDDALRREYEALQDTKAALDRRSAPSPDADVVDDIVERAGAAAQQGPADDDPAALEADRAPDRAAQAPERRGRRRLRGVSAVLAVLLVAGVGWWQFQATDPSASGTTASTPTSQSSEAVTSETTPAADQSDSAVDTVPEWDGREDVVRLHRRIEQLRTRSRSDTWEEGPQTVGQTTP